MSIRTHVSLTVVAGALLVGLCLVLVTTASVLATPGNGQGPDQNPQDTGCNANNPKNCPSPTPICGNGNHTGNPHCEEALATPTPTPSTTPSTTPTPTPDTTPLPTDTPTPTPEIDTTPTPTPAGGSTATPTPTPTASPSGVGGNADETDCCPGLDEPTATPTPSKHPRVAGATTAVAAPNGKVETLTQFPSSGPALPIIPAAASILGGAAGLVLQRIRANHWFGM